MILGPPSAVQVNDTISLNSCNSKLSDGLGVMVMSVIFGRSTVWRENMMNVTITLYKYMDILLYLWLLN